MLQLMYLQCHCKTNKSHSIFTFKAPLQASVNGYPLDHYVGGFLLKVYHSNSLDILRDVLVEMISREPIRDPFRAEQILVQSPGMAQWLKLELAQRLKIAANIDFPLPASFLWRTFSQLLVDVPERSAYSKESMSWILMRILPEYLPQLEFRALAHYMADDEVPIKLYQLCEKIADLFDQYLVYRPDWIAQWEQQNNAPAVDEQLWQPILWRAIVADTQRRNFPHWHRANMFDAFIKAIESSFDEHSTSAELPQRIFVFGISALPENYLQALVALGKRCDIHLMVANPCRQFWSDIVDKRYLGKLARRNNQADQAKIAQLSAYEQGNPLLASMGKLGRDYLYMLGQLELPEVQLFGADDNSSLLKSIQSDILSLRNRRSITEDQQAKLGSDQQRLAIASSDDSISVHCCHSAMREVEVLQDQILAMLEQDPALEPRDIIVMMPDVSAYSPFVEAVFGQAKPSHYLPFSISDRNAQQESPLIANFLSLLTMIKSRYGASDVLELLSLPALLRRFELDEAKFDQLRNWILESGIKWGLDADNRAELALPSFAQNSWQFGLDRMFAGFALGEVNKTWQGIAPYSQIEGLDAPSLGQLASFVEVLQRCKLAFSGSSNIVEWIAFFHQLVDDLYLPDDSDLAAIEIIYTCLEKLQTTIDEVDYQQSIPAEIVLDYLQQSLTAQRSGQRFLSGQINFCTLMPMRAIPFKVVCLLGMNDGDYPRSVPAMGFDLMAEHGRKGDRSRRDDDRYLFLEALLSATAKLYVSYVGRSIADNSSRTPSVLISELLEYAQQGYFLAMDESGENFPAAHDSLLAAANSSLSGQAEGSLLSEAKASLSLHAEGSDAAAQLVLKIQQQSAQLLQHLILEHPLTAYHRRYFEQHSRFFSYAEQWLPIADTVPTQQGADFIQTLPASDLENLALTSLVSFFRQPVRYFLQHKLQVNFIDDAVMVEDEEPFALAGLDNYILRDRMLQSALLEKDLHGFNDYLGASGLLPIGHAGSKLLSKNLQDATELAEKVAPLITGTKRRLSFDLEIDNLQLQGWIEPLYEIGVVKYSAANSSGRSYICTWVEHLAACANGCDHATYFRAINQQFHFRAVATEQAIDYLRELLQLYRQGLQKPLAWLPDLGWQLYNADDVSVFLRDVESNYNNFADPYIQRVFPKWQNISSGLMAVNQQILAPLAEYLVIDSEGNE